MIDLVVNDDHLFELLEGPPSLEDNVDGICKRLTFSLKGHKLEGGATVQLFFNGKRVFYGQVRRKGYGAHGTTDYTAYDPLYLWKSKDDFYIKGKTLSQVCHLFIKNAGLKAGVIANTKTVLPQLWYRGEEMGKAFVDMTVRQHRLNKKIYTVRFNPVTVAVDLVEVGIAPKEIWAFQTGINLTDASYEEDAEQLFTQVKLVDRETGKTVTKVNTSMKTKYGKMQEFEEIDKAEAANIDNLAAQKLAAVSAPIVRGTINGVNPGSMPVFNSADIIYVEQKAASLLGSYHIRSASHSFESADMITAAYDIQKSAFVPDIQVEDATKDPNAKDTTSGGSVKPIDLAKKLPGIKYLSGWKATAYALTGTTASGTKVQTGRTIAVDPRQIPLGSIVAIHVPGASKYTGIYLAEDTGGVIKGKIIDIAIQPKATALQFGRQSIQVAVLERGKGAKDALSKAGRWDSIEKAWQQKLSPKVPANTKITGPAATKVEKVMREARKWIGRLKYDWGGKKITNGLGDCSGYTYYVYNTAIGLKLGHGTMTQVTKGRQIPTSQARAGDLVFFKGTIKDRAKHLPSHVGIVTRPGFCISLGGSGCKEHSYTSGAYGPPHFMQIRRVIE